MLILEALIAGVCQNRNGRKRTFGLADFEVVNTAFIGLRYAQNQAIWLDHNSDLYVRELFKKSFP